MFEARVRKEYKLLQKDPPSGIRIYIPNSNDDNVISKILFAQIDGPKDTPYELGIYKLQIKLTEKYPIDPPNVIFLTPIYHPNIDCDGRICLNILKSEPQGDWSPASNLNTVLISIGVLLNSPNPHDGLNPNATELYKKDIFSFNETAKNYNMKYAMNYDNNNIQQFGIYNHYEVGNIHNIIDNNNNNIDNDIDNKNKDINIKVNNIKIIEFNNENNNIDNKFVTNQKKGIQRIFRAANGEIIKIQKIN